MASVWKIIIYSYNWYIFPFSHLFCCKPPKSLIPLWNIILFDITKMDPYAVITKDNVGKYEYLNDSQKVLFFSFCYEIISNSF